MELVIADGFQRLAADIIGVHFDVQELPGGFKHLSGYRGDHKLLERG